KVLTLQTVPSQAAPPTQQRCVNAQGFSLHAEVCCDADQRKKLEHLCRYITRPAIANERLTRNGAGDVVLQLKSPYHDGTTHVVMSPLEFMQRLAALVPRPRLHLIRFHGVLAPNARLRPEIIPSSGRPAGVPVPPTVPLNAHTPSADQAEALPPAAPARLSWARLLKRVFAIDLEHCPHCGGPLTIIAAIEHPPVIAKILAHLGLPARAPPRSPARSLDRFPMA
ncbi:MAG: transposase, partial [Gammaproteobacteria bacterium]